MIAYGEEFPEFVADYLARGPERFGRFSSHQSSSKGRASFGRPTVGEDQGGGSRGPMRQGSSGASDNVLGQRDPPRIGRSEERPSGGRAMPAPTRGGGCANGVNSAEMQYPPPASPTSRGSRTPGSRPITLKTQAWRQSASSPRSVPIVCPERGSPFTPRRGSCASRRPPPPSGPRRRAPTDPVALTEGPGEDALITRPDCDVRVRVLPPLGYDFALKMREGATLIEAVTALDDPAFDFGTHLVGLVESGAVASIIPGQAS